MDLLKIVKSDIDSHYTSFVMKLCMQREKVNSRQTDNESELGSKGHKVIIKG